MTENTPSAPETEDYEGAPEPLPAFPEHHPNPHNHIYTISMNGQGPMIVVRGNTPAEINERFQSLLDGGVTTLAASVFSHMKAEMAVASGVGPVSPAPAPQAPPAPPAPGGGVNYNPAAPPPGVPGTAPAAWQNAGAPPAPSAAPQGQWGAPQGAAPARNGPKPRPTDWPSVFRIEVPFNAKDQFKAFREQYKDAFKGKIAWAGGGGYWVHGDVVQSFGNYNPVPA
ncbi:hypothetical protein ACIOHE_26260 [Streptomyces sp. NPDC087851]|uniref:hypothetical protein n=1 Tax=Streptomyces sp. NPDC087851 TaxID=3365810 RepID=UPI0037FED2C8